MFAKVAFVQKDDSLSKTYDYQISHVVDVQLAKNDFVIVESSRGAYSIGVYLEAVETVENPDIVTKKVVGRAFVPNYEEYMKGAVTHG